MLVLNHRHWMVIWYITYYQTACALLQRMKLPLSLVTTWRTCGQQLALYKLHKHGLPTKAMYRKSTLTTSLRLTRSTTRSCSSIQMAHLTPSCYIKQVILSTKMVKWFCAIAKAKSSTEVVFLSRWIKTHCAGSLPCSFWKGAIALLPTNRPQPTQTKLHGCLPLILSINWEATLLRHWSAPTSTSTLKLPWVT